MGWSDEIGEKVAPKVSDQLIVPPVWYNGVQFCVFFDFRNSKNEKIRENSKMVQILMENSQFIDVREM